MTSYIDETIAKAEKIAEAMGFDSIDSALASLESENSGADLNGKSS